MNTLAFTVTSATGDRIEFPLTLLLLATIVLGFVALYLSYRWGFLEGLLKGRDNSTPDEDESEDEDEEDDDGPKCESCGAPATHQDLEGVPLCSTCGKMLEKEDPADEEEDTHGYVHPKVVQEAANAFARNIDAELTGEYWKTQGPKIAEENKFLKDQQQARMKEHEILRKSADEARLTLDKMREEIRRLQNGKQVLAEDNVRLRNVIDHLVGALHWCSGFPDFNQGGKARSGWILGPEAALRLAREVSPGKAAFNGEPGGGDLALSKEEQDLVYHGGHIFPINK